MQTPTRFRFSFRWLAPSIIALPLLTGCLSDSSSDSSNTVSGGGGGGGASTCTSVTYPAPSGASNNIVFTFDKAYTCGQFANGDWWVSVDAGGYVTVNSITPDRATTQEFGESSAHMHHGYELYPNPLSIPNVNYQAFDSNAATVNRDPATGALIGSAPYTTGSGAIDVAYDPWLKPADLPLQIPGQTSLVKAVSRIPVPATTVRPHIQFAAVLTVLSSPLANSTQYFRPPYFGKDKPLISVAGIQWSQLPTTWAAAGVVGGTDKPSIADVATRFSGVRLDHYTDFDGRDMHPLDSMPTYGSDIASQNATHLLRMAINDFNINNASHRQAMINYLQMAVDLLGMAKPNYTGDLYAIGDNLLTNLKTTWDMGGGHGNGRKLPLAFAAWILNNSDFTTAIGNSVFAEDISVFQHPTTNRTLFGQNDPESAYWQHLNSVVANQLNPIPADDLLDPLDAYSTCTAPAGPGLGSGGACGCSLIGSKDIRDPYGYIDGGSELGGEYQSVNGPPWKYTVLAYKYMFPGVAVKFSNTLLPAYIKRLYVDTGPIGNGVYDSCAAVDIAGFVPATCSFTTFSTGSTLPAYAGTYGPANASGTSCKTGTGRFPTYNLPGEKSAQPWDNEYESRSPPNPPPDITDHHNQNGFGDLLWDWYKGIYGITP